MKFIISIMMFCSWSAFSGGLFVMVGDENSGIGAPVKFYMLEFDKGKGSFLYIQNDKNDACRIPIVLLKDLNIDPVQFGDHLRNSTAGQGPVLTCHVTDKNRFVATSIDVQSFLGH